MVRRETRSAARFSGERAGLQNGSDVMLHGCGRARIVTRQRSGREASAMAPDVPLSGTIHSDAFSCASEGDWTVTMACGAMRVATRLFPPMAGLERMRRPCAWPLSALISHLWL